MLWNKHNFIILVICLETVLSKTYRREDSEFENQIQLGQIITLDNEDKTLTSDDVIDEVSKEEATFTDAEKNNNNNTKQEKEAVFTDKDENSSTKDKEKKVKEEKKETFNNNKTSVKDDDVNFTHEDEKANTYDKTHVNDKSCWIKMNVDRFVKDLDKLDEKYSKLRDNDEDNDIHSKFDTDMISMMKKSGGAAERTVYKFGKYLSIIPAGINLGGYSMLRMPKNIMFFHRIKLRNDTHFKLNFLHNDMKNMVMHARISLNDLHLSGTYDRTVTDSDPSNLFYVPTYGQAEFLLKNVKYKMEGRYRLIKNRLHLVSVISEINMEDILLTYHNKNSSAPAIQLDKKNIESFLDKLKTDLNEWLKDYFNDYLMYVEPDEKTSDDEFQKYNNDKTALLNDFTDNAISLIIRKLHQVKVGSVKLPKFTIFTVNGMQIRLKDGVLRGLDSMFRRSVATGRKDRDLYKVDAEVGFSKIKVTYSYDAVLATGVPPLSGSLTLTANDLLAHLALSMVNDPDSVDLDFRYLKQGKPESLTIEGPANRMVSHFRFLLEGQIIALMTNTLIHNINMLSTITRCVPLLSPYNDPDEDYLDKAGKEDDTSVPESTADFVIWKKDNVELQFPPENNNKGQKLLMKYKEKMELSKLN